MKFQLTSINHSDRTIDLPGNAVLTFSDQLKLWEYLEAYQAGWTSAALVALPENESKLEGYVLKTDDGMYFKGPGNGWGRIPIEHAFVMSYNEASEFQGRVNITTEIVKVKLIMAQA